MYYYIPSFPLGAPDSVNKYMICSKMINTHLGSGPQANTLEHVERFVELKNVTAALLWYTDHTVS